MCRWFVITLLLSITLTACAVSNDPRKGGLFGGLHGLSTGAYDSRIHQRQEELSGQQRLNQDLNEQSQTLQSTAQDRDLALASEQEHMAKMEADLSSLESDIKQLNAKSDKQKSEIAILNRKIEDHRLRLKSQQYALAELDRAGGSAADPGRYQMLKRERDRLAEEYRRLVKYLQALSDASR